MRRAEPGRRDPATPWVIGAVVAGLAGLLLARRRARPDDRLERRTRDRLMRPAAAQVPSAADIVVARR